MTASRKTQTHNFRYTIMKAFSSISRKLTAGLASILLVVFTLSCSAPANAQTVQPLFPNLSNLKGDSFTYKVIKEKSASYTEAEEAAVMKIRRLHAKQLSLPIDDVSVVKMRQDTEVLRNNVYEVFEIVENKDGSPKDGVTRITKVYLVPKKDFAKR